MLDTSSSNKYLFYTHNDFQLVLVPGLWFPEKTQEDFCDECHHSLMCLRDTFHKEPLHYPNHFRRQRVYGGLQVPKFLNIYSFTFTSLSCSMEAHHVPQYRTYTKKIPLVKNFFLLYNEQTKRKDQKCQH